jgi:putative phosphoribosyl transferase
MITFSQFPAFRDRTDAGQRLAVRLRVYADRPDVVVLALPRGGVPVAFEIARELNAPLDAFVVRKLGVPGHREYAVGAIASGGVRVIDDLIVHSLGIPSSVIDDVAAEELRELERREQLYRGCHLPLEISGQIVIVVDDGMATGSSMRAAITALRLHQPARIVVAVPVAPSSACEELRAHVDELVCLAEPESFIAVGQWYEDFRQINDYDVHDILAKASAALNPVKV